MIGGVPVRISDESEALLDTGGGLLQAATLFTPGDEPILIHNVDILSNADLRTFYEANRDCEAALMVSERVTQRYLLFDDEMRLRGWTNLATGEVRSPYPDLDVNSLHRYAFSGIHCFSPRLFEVMKDLGYAGRFPIMDSLSSGLCTSGYPWFRSARFAALGCGETRHPVSS